MRGHTWEKPFDVTTQWLGLIPKAVSFRASPRVRRHAAPACWLREGRKREERLPALSVSCHPSCPSFCLLCLCVTLLVVDPSAARCSIFSGPLGPGILTERAGADAAAVPGVTHRSLWMIWAFKTLPPDCAQLPPWCSFEAVLLPVSGLFWSGLCALLYVLSSDGMCVSALAASIWTSGTLLSRCSSPTPQVFLPAGTRCSNSTQICVARQAPEH